MVANNRRGDNPPLAKRTGSATKAFAFQLRLAIRHVGRDMPQPAAAGRPRLGRRFRRNAHSSVTHIDRRVRGRASRSDRNEIGPMSREPSAAPTTTGSSGTPKAGRSCLRRHTRGLPWARSARSAQSERRRSQQFPLPHHATVRRIHAPTETRTRVSGDRSLIWQHNVGAHRRGTLDFRHRAALRRQRPYETRNQAMVEQGLAASSDTAMVQRSTL